MIHIYLNIVDTNLLVEESDVRLSNDKFNTKMKQKKNYEHGVLQDDDELLPRKHGQYVIG